MQVFARFRVHVYLNIVLNWPFVLKANNCAVIYSRGQMERRKTALPGMFHQTLGRFTTITQIVSVWVCAHARVCLWVCAPALLQINHQQQPCILCQGWWGLTTRKPDRMTLMTWQTDYIAELPEIMWKFLLPPEMTGSRMTQASHSCLYLFLGFWATCWHL